MRKKTCLEMIDAARIGQAAMAHAQSKQWAVSIAVVDDGAGLMWFQRADNAAPISAHIAQAKATTSAMGKRESRIYEEMINNGRMSFLSAPQLSGLLEGGVPIMVDGQCVGAVGVSGVKSAEDAEIARAGIDALGL